MYGLWSGEDGHEVDQSNFIHVRSAVAVEAAPIAGGFQVWRRLCMYASSGIMKICLPVQEESFPVPDCHVVDTYLSVLLGLDVLQFFGPCLIFAPTSSRRHGCLGGCRSITRQTMSSFLSFSETGN